MFVRFIHQSGCLNKCLKTSKTCPDVLPAKIIESTNIKDSDDSINVKNVELSCTANDNDNNYYGKSKPNKNYKYKIKSKYLSSFKS